MEKAREHRDTQLGQHSKHTEQASSALRCAHVGLCVCMYMGVCVNLNVCVCVRLAVCAGVHLGVCTCALCLGVCAPACT